MDQLPVELHPDVPDPEIGHFGTLRSLHFASIFSLSPTFSQAFSNHFQQNNKEPQINETNQNKTKTETEMRVFLALWYG